MQLENTNEHRKDETNLFLKNDCHGDSSLVNMSCVCERLLANICLHLISNITVIPLERAIKTNIMTRIDRQSEEDWMERENS